VGHKAEATTMRYSWEVGVGLIRRREEEEGGGGRKKGG